jgi:pimeloyl-ACP methyl ester carboxylesterase
LTATEPRAAGKQVSAAPIVLLHGQPGSAGDWNGVVSALGADTSVLAPTRPGWGAGRAGGLQHNAAALLATLDAEGLDRATIVGHSLGGSVAAWVAAHHPDRVARLVLAAPAANLASIYALDRWLALPVAGFLTSSALMAGTGVTLAWPAARRAAGGRLGLDERFLRQAGRTLRAPSAWRTFVTEQRGLLRELPSLEPRLGAITAPTTIVVGSRDRIVGAGSARRLATQIPGARLVELPGAGHLLPLQQPVRLAEVILG